MAVSLVCNLCEETACYQSLTCLSETRSAVFLLKHLLRAFPPPSSPALHVLARSAASLIGWLTVCSRLPVPATCAMAHGLRGDLFLQLSGYR